MKSLTLKTLALVIGLAFGAGCVLTVGANQDATTTPDASPVASPAAVEPKLNLNTATEEEFRTVPGVGDRMVREFFEYRPYASIVQFREEIGKYVDEEQVATYEQYVFVPVVPNDADAETLQQLPGVDETIAEELIAARPYDTDDAFLTELGEHVAADQVEAARTYLATA